MTRFLLLCASIVTGVAIFACPAFAYDETGSGRACVQCHGAGTVDPAAEGTGRQGPHGGYTTATDKCSACHSVHAASSTGVVLLPAATIKANCEVCHDGTGGTGVYGVVKARTGNDPTSGHRIDVTNSIDGGDASTGDARTQLFSGVDGNLTCTDCHSPHGALTVDAFRGDRRRVETSTPDPSDGTADVGFTSNRLLRSMPTGYSGTAIQKYGSDWCAACHMGRMDGATVFNHPVESAADFVPSTDAFHYDNVQVVTGVGALTTTSGSLGRSNRGFVMPYPYTSGADGNQAGHKPICQQCHEDARDVGDDIQGTISAAEEFTNSTIDGATGDVPQTGNPIYHTFPHESDNRALLVEVPDDLCMNCHDPGAQLP